MFVIVTIVDDELGQVEVRQDKALAIQLGVDLGTEQTEHSVKAIRRALGTDRVFRTVSGDICIYLREVDDIPQGGLSQGSLS